MADIWRVLCIHLGTPPEQFDWQWHDKDKQFHRKGAMTPQNFLPVRLSRLGGLRLSRG